MQFASGTPPLLVKKSDLKAELTADEAHAQMAVSISAFLATKLASGTAAATSGAKLLQEQVAATGEMVAPIIAALELEGFTHFVPQCNSDHTLPASCPFYPR